MVTFGELIYGNKLVLIHFYTQFNQPQNLLKILRDVAAVLRDKVKVVKIDIEKNELLAEALSINNKPTFIIYKNGEIKWRNEGSQDAATLIEAIKNYY
mgnify:CR=1 FL=1